MGNAKIFMPIAASLAASLAILASCASEKKESALHAGSVWQNGKEIYIAEDSTSFWHLYGGTLHEGGSEMKLMKDGKWLLPIITDNRPTDSLAGTWRLDGDTIVFSSNDKTTSRLALVSGLTVLSRDDMPSKALPALDSVQQMNVYRSLEGTYKDQNGKKWVFSGNSMKRQGLGTPEPYSIGKSMDMNDCVIFTNNIAYAYSITPQGISLYKAEYVDSVGIWKYDKKGKPVEQLVKK